MITVNDLEHFSSHHLNDNLDSLCETKLKAVAVGASHPNTLHPYACPQQTVETAREILARRGQG